MYGTHAELAAKGVDTTALLGLLQEEVEKKSYNGDDEGKGNQKQGNCKGGSPVYLIITTYISQNRSKKVFTNI